jgi:hypothetical protein
MPLTKSGSLTVLILAFILMGIGAFAYSRSHEQAQPTPILNAPPDGPITIRGTLICLPHRDATGPQTLECAYGLKDTVGRQYGLRDSDPTYKNISGIAMGAPVEAVGTFESRHDEKYESVGIITITSLTIPDTPKRTTLTGTYVCLPHTNSTSTQTDECITGIKTDDGLYYALDFGPLSQTLPQLKAGDRISANGLLVPKEQLSTDYWNKYPITGIFSVTDSLKQLR